jgi:SPP1 gp7 family putative phage head morphogenesis protein
MKKLKKPKRYDPTRTGLIRKRFEREMNHRFVSLKREVYDLIATEDVLGLSSGNLVNNAKWSFANVADGVSRFKDWLTSRMDRLVLGESGIKTKEGKWTDEHIQTAYFKGAEQAANSILPYKSDKTESWVSRSLKSPINLNKVLLLKQRAFEQLKNVTQAISLQLGNILSDGIVKGESPRQVARTMVKEIDSIQKKRAVTIARTETIRAHAEGSLESMKQMGVQTVGVDVEWQATMVDPDNGIFEEKVCPQCQALAGMVIPIEQASGLIPRHPNCRCAFVPNILGRTPNAEVRTRIAKSIVAGLSKKKIKTTKAADLLNDDSWPGTNLLLK